MLARNTFRALIPKPCYRTPVQRNIRCCSVLLANQGKKGNSFQLPEKLKMKKIALENKFKNRFPRTAQLVFQVRDGVTALISDSKDMMLVEVQVFKGTKQIEDLNLRELELVHETMFHIKKMLPVIVIFAIPVLGNFIAVFLAYIKPLSFLSPHFWTDEQKVAKTKEEHANRVSVFLPIMKYLETNSPSSTDLGSKFRNILASVQSGYSPNLSELVQCQGLFSGNQIFSLGRLPMSQLDNLLTLHCRRGTFLKNFYLREWVTYMKLVDERIGNHEEVSKLPSEQLKRYCFQRGVNANAMTEKEMCDYLTQWISFSKQIPFNSISLLLYAPAIIGFSHKANLSVTNDCSL